MKRWQYEIPRFKADVFKRDIEKAKLPEVVAIGKAMETEVVTVSFIRPLTDEEQATLKTLAVNHDPEPLWWAQETALDGINGEIEYRIIGPWGFEYPEGSGNHFSCSQRAQAKWGSLYAARDALEYPYTIRTKDDSKSYVIADAIELANVYYKMVQTIAGVLNEGNAIKDKVLAAEVSSVALGLMREYIGSRPPVP